MKTLICLIPAIILRTIKGSAARKIANIRKVVISVHSLSYLYYLNGVD